MSGPSRMQSNDLGNAGFCSRFWLAFCFFFNSSVFCYLSLAILFCSGHRVYHSKDVHVYLAFIIDPLAIDTALCSS